MVWGQRGAGIDDLLRRLETNDPGLKSFTLMRQRRLDGVQDVERLCAAMRANTHLTELNVTAHAISPEAARVFAALLAASTHLTAIAIGTAQFGDAAMAELATGVAASKSLTAWDAELKGLGSPSGAAIARALGGCALLTSLNLGRNPLGDAGVVGLCSAAWHSLRRLQLHDCQLGAAGLQALADSPGVVGLEVLELGFNQRLGMEAAPALATLLARATRLQRLDLQQTQVGDAGAASLSAGLQQGCPSLTELNVASTGITADGVQAIAEALRSVSCRLTSLTLAGNAGVDDAAVSALASAAAARQLLQHLDISVTSATHTALEALAALPGLRTLAMLGCKLGGGGGARLAELLLQSPGSAFCTLQELGVSATHLDGPAVRGVLAALEGAAAGPLRSIEIGGNPGCEADDMHDHVERLRAVRPDLAVHWRSGDQAPA